MVFLVLNMEHGNWFKFLKKKKTTTKDSNWFIPEISMQFFCNECNSKPTAHNVQQSQWADICDRFWAHERIYVQVLYVNYIKKWASH